MTEVLGPLAADNFVVDREERKTRLKNSGRPDSNCRRKSAGRFRSAAREFGFERIDLPWRYQRRQTRNGLDYFVEVSRIRQGWQTAFISLSSSGVARRAMILSYASVGDQG